VYESRVDRFRGRPNAPRIADKAPMVPALWVRPGQGYLDTVVGTSYCTVEAVLIEHWPLCRVNGYCWSTPFKVLGVLFLGGVSSAFLPSKKACWTHIFRHVGVDQQYPPVKSTGWIWALWGQPGCRTSRSKNLCPLASSAADFSTLRILLTFYSGHHPPSSPQHC